MAVASKSRTARVSWADALASASRDRPVDTVPRGWKTCQQIAAETGRSASHTVAILADLVARGKAECRKFRVKTTSRVMPIQHYRLL